MGFRVYNAEGEDVTDNNDWYINQNGCLFWMDDDGIHEAELFGFFARKFI